MSLISIVLIVIYPAFGKDLKPLIGTLQMDRSKISTTSQRWGINWLFVWESTWINMSPTNTPKPKSVKGLHNFFVYYSKIKITLPPHPK